METKKSNAEHIRPILQAMERSIDTARRNRVKQPTMMPPSSPIGTQPSPATSIPTSSPGPSFGTTPAASETAGRLKARPKRLDSPFVTPLVPAPYRSQAG